MTRKNMITTAEFAELTGVTVRTIQRHVKPGGDLHPFAVRIGRVIRLDWAAYTESCRRKHCQALGRGMKPEEIARWHKMHGSVSPFE